MNRHYRRMEMDCKPTTRQYDQNIFYKIINCYDRIYYSIFKQLPKDSQAILKARQDWLRQSNKRDLIENRLAPYFYTNLLTDYLNTSKNGPELPEFVIKEQLIKQAQQLAEQTFNEAVQDGRIDAELYTIN